MATEVRRRAVQQQQQQVEEEEGEVQAEMAEEPQQIPPDPDLPIDRGWAWVIMAASFFSIFFGIGYLKAFGIIFMEFLRVLKTSRLVTSIIVGVQQACFSIGGLITQTVLLTYLSVRQCVMAGGLLISLGIILTHFVNSITFFIFTQSLLVGMGTALMANPCFILIGQYFMKYRAMAIAVAGIAINAGGIIVPLLLTRLLHEYGIGGTMLIYGALTLNIIVCGALLRPFEFYTKPSLHRRQKKFADHELPESMQPLVNGNSGVDGTEEGELKMDKISPAVNSEESGTSTSGSVSNGRKADQLTNSSGDFVEPKEEDAFIAEEESKLTKENPADTLAAEDSQESDRKLPQPSGSQPTSSSSEQQKNQDGTPISAKKNSASPDRGVTSNSRKGLSKCIFSCWTPFIATFEFSLFKIPAFLIILSMSFFGVLPAALIGVFIPDLAGQRGVSDFWGSLLITISNCVAIVSRIILGFVVDSRKVKLTTIFVVVQTLSCIAPFCCDLYRDFPSFLGLSLTYGFLGDVFFTMQPLLIVEMLGLEKMAKTLGFIMLVNGLSLALITPLTAWLKDTTGGYDATFILLGVAALLCAAIVGVYVLVNNFLQRRRPRPAAEELVV